MSDASAAAQTLNEVLQVIRESAEDRSWTIDVTKPSTHNPTKVYVAHIRNSAGEALGLGMSAEGSALAVCEAWRSAYEGEVRK